MLEAGKSHPEYSESSQLSSSSLATSPRPDRKIMLITPERVVYASILGKPLTRQFGAIAIYISLGIPFQIRLAGQDWQSADMWVVAPDTPHEIMTLDRKIGVMMVEPETVDPAHWPEALRPVCHGEGDQAFVGRLRGAFLAMMRGEVNADHLTRHIDDHFLGQPLTRRSFDPRIARVVERINAAPCDTLGAEDHARAVGLSFSRFLHLFKEDVGATFRSFRAWKRARSFLSYVNTELSLTDIALETGYPDSSHFSHTVRRYWGLTPKDIIAGSRKLAVITHSATCV